MTDHPHQLGHIGGTIITALLAVFPTLAEWTEIAKLGAHTAAIIVAILTAWSIWRDQRRKERREAERIAGQARYHMRYKEEEEEE